MPVRTGNEQNAIFWPPLNPLPSPRLREGATKEGPLFSNMLVRSMPVHKLAI